MANKIGLEKEHHIRVGERAIEDMLDPFKSWARMMDEKNIAGAEPSPGPWLILDFDQTEDYLIQIRSEPQDRLVAAAIHDDPDTPTPEDVANAILIKHAPDMYAALKAIADISVDAKTKQDELSALCIEIASIELKKFEGDKA